MTRPKRRLRATYRLQFNKDFTFRDATRLVDYFAALGISHLYASPFLKARPGSTHGYDIVDHNQLNPEIGDEADFDALVDALKSRGMGLVLDFVPNHMGVAAENPWWNDVLEWGESSPYAPFFDIDWDAARPDLRGKVLLPVLGDQYGTILIKGEIQLRFDATTGSFFVAYWDHRFPIAPTDYPELLAAVDPPAAIAEDFARLADDLTLLGAEAGRRWRPGIHAQAAELKRGLAALCDAHPELGGAIEASLATFYGREGDRRSWGSLHALLERQSYRLAYWRVAADEINYRRFFNINDLAGLRIELPELFDRAHRLVFRLLVEEKLDGLRIDHIDGLFDPGEYCNRLQARYAELKPENAPLWVTVEKILAHDEGLPEWPVAGTTGYEFTNQVLGLFVDPAGKEPLTRIYKRLTERTQSFDQVLYASKQRIMQVNLASEMNILARDFHRLSMHDWRSRDFTLNGMRDALEEVISFFPVYRTYVDRRGAGDNDRRIIEFAVRQAKRHSPASDTSIFDWIGRVLTGTPGGGYNRAEALRLAMRLQQVTGPVMAKGLEDTSFYRYFRFVALNEVGGDPRRVGLPPEDFHRINAERRERWPDMLLTTATHDTKRGEDMRARLALLSEMPREVGERAARWMRMNRAHRSDVGGDLAPDSNHEYFFYQAVLGAWPPGLKPNDEAGVTAFAERMDAYMLKAAREGKELSSWANPDSEYEAALSRFVKAALTAGSAFVADLAEAAQRVARLAAINGLAQTLLKLALPGVPDIYQGAELWDYALVDPDNRRPVDWSLRRHLLEATGEDAALDGLAKHWQDGREKLFLIRRTLGFRAKAEALFAEGDYAPLEASGARSAHLFAFRRAHAGAAIIVAVPRLVATLHGNAREPDWKDTALDLGDRRWRDIFTGEEHRGPTAASALLRRFPVALLAAP